MKGLLDMTYTFSNGSYIGGRMPFLYVHGLLASLVLLILIVSNETVSAAFRTLTYCGVTGVAATHSRRRHTAELPPSHLDGVGLLS